MGGARFLGLGGEVTRRVGHGAPCLSNIPLFVATSGEKPALRFRPRAVVAGRGVVAVCTRISSQEYVYDE